MPVYNRPLIYMLVRFGWVLPVAAATQPLCKSTLWEDTWPWTSVASEGHFPQCVSWVVCPKVEIWVSPQRATYCIGSTMKCMEALGTYANASIFRFIYALGISIWIHYYDLCYFGWSYMISLCKCKQYVAPKQRQGHAGLRVAEVELEMVHEIPKRRPQRHLSKGMSSSKCLFLASDFEVMSLLSDCVTFQ